MSRKDGKNQGQKIENPNLVIKPVIGRQQQESSEIKQDNSNLVTESVIGGQQQESSEIKDICFRAFDFSRKFFTAGIKKQFTSLDELKSDNYLTKIGELKIEKDGRSKDINTVLQKMSLIYRDITTFPVYEKGVKNNVQKRQDLKLTILKNKKGLGKHVIDIVKSHYPDKKPISSDKYILFMQGPVGSYKNRLLQYVYLSLCGEFAKEGSKKAPVFYIDFSKYESSSEDFNIGNDIKTIKGIIESHQVPPLFILDNVRGFKFGNIQNIYSQFSRDIIEQGDSKCIVSRDVEFSRMSSHDLPLPFGNDSEDKKANYKNIINITSISTYNEDKCESFLTNCIQYFALVGDVKNSGQFNNVELFYQCLMSMEETKIDAYQIKLILGAMLQNSSDQIKPIVEAMFRENGKKGGKNSKNNITIGNIIGYIYDEIFKCIFNDTGQQQTSEDNSQNVYKMAYGYEHDSQYTINNDNIAQWCKIIEHRSILDYCIAQYYIQQLKNDIKKEPQEWSYNVPNAFFYKGINRFIVPKVKTEWNIVEYTKTYFTSNKGLSIIQNAAKLAQLIHIVGKFESEDSLVNSEATIILSGIKTNIYNQIKESQIQSEALVFLLRTTYVSLIWREKDDAAIEYFSTLIEKGQDGNLSEAANINIGFHLDYYGDTVVGIGDNQVPNYVKEGQIKVTKCLNTLRRLSSEIGRKISEDKMDEIGILHLITFCHILRKRMHNGDLEEIDPNSDFRTKCREWCAKCYNKYQNMSTKRIQITAFLKKESILLQEKKWPNVCNRGRIIKYNKYSRLNEIPRTGWITRGIQEGFEKREGGNNYYKKYSVPENVAEHTLNCWLLGYIFLPEDDYKQRVLDLLLVHDFAEVKVGDIIIKTPDDIKDEEAEMGRFLNGLKSEKLLENWKKVWVTDYEEGDAQYIQVAYDIDKIQAMYQYFSYYAADVIEKNNVEDWLGEYDNLRTNIGKGIAKKVVFLNNKFSDNDELFCLFYDKYTEIEKNEKSNKTDAKS